MADLFDLHPAVIYALRTGNLDQAREAAAQVGSSIGAPSRPDQHRSTQTRPGQRYTEADPDEDDFYGRLNRNPFGR